MRFELVTILLVDDNQHMRILLTEILRAIGVRPARPPVHAVDGVDFVRLLRNSQDSPNPMCPVIMLSGHSTERRIFEARDVGVNEFLSKPVTARGVLSRISQIIDHPRPFIRCEDYFGPDRRRRQDPSYQGPRRRVIDNPFEQVLD